MSRQTIEVELLDTSREQPGVQDAQYGWPYPPVRHYEQRKCEMQYRAFRDSYKRIDRVRNDGEPPTLTDAELRMRWLEYYREFVDPTQRQLEGFAREVSACGRSPLAGLSSNDKNLLYAIIAFVVCAAILFH